MRFWTTAFALGALLCGALLLGSVSGSFAQSGGPQDTQITSAQFAEATGRYPHGVLGDAQEWARLEIETTGGGRTSHVLPQTRVFEDLGPRLWDVTGDGAPEVVVVESDQDQGARLVIYDAHGVLAATPYIGQRFRWLAPVAAADLDGDGHIELAYVDRPHLAKTLRIWRYRDGALHQVGAASGVSNHQIGWDYIVGGARNCGAGSDARPEMILPSGDWRQLLAVRFDGTDIAARILGDYTPGALTRALACDSVP